MSFFNRVITKYILGKQEAQALPMFNSNGRQQTKTRKTNYNNQSKICWYNAINGGILAATVQQRQFTLRDYIWLLRNIYHYSIDYFWTSRQQQRIFIKKLPDTILVYICTATGPIEQLFA